MNTFIRKITSRKFWAAVVNFVTQILIACMRKDSASPKPSTRSNAVPIL